ncbi:MAG TPA: PHP-associated domain-containing protein [Candidatus Aminicenantes bacterium]|nr:PHP-associated domain-containing protein [Candidatus Aminicenantes bacterium]
MTIAADLHIHSALSPCAALEMSPAAIVSRAREAGLDLIAVTDHNSVENGFFAAEAGARAGMRVLFGMEAQTREDVHVLCYFEQRLQAERFHGRVYPLLPDMANNPDYFGDQVVVDAEDNIVRHEGKLLLNALDISVPELVELVREHGGLAVPAHVEASPYGLLVNLGMVPPELGGMPLEISADCPREQALREFPALARHPLLRNSDAHFLRDIGRARTEFTAPEPTLAALLAAARAGRFRADGPADHG